MNRLPEFMMLRKTLWALGIIWVACVAALWVLYIVASPTTSATFVQELTKVLLQLATVAALGSVVSLITAQFNRDKLDQDRIRDEANRLIQNRDEFRKQLLVRIHVAYASVKRAKRLLRARGFSPPFYPTQNPKSRVVVPVYDEQLQLINDVQLDLEMLAKELEANTAAFSTPSEIIRAVQLMEGRLKELVTEYEQERGSFGDEPLTKHAAELPILKNFASPRHQSGLAQAFSDAYGQAVRALLADILEHGPQDLRRITSTPKSTTG